MENIKSAYNNKFKISAPTWNDEFDLPDDHILLHKYIIKEYETMDLCE